ncbi:GFA family protein [Marinobacter sp. SS21]|uniref:GFA family protein n=1 Tax=Marinobacter sp. SS21 TaxID=2979460 RepID=UPI00232D860B|nr:GFA family protein [Marinobacter sp. SS21]MDC0661396.1 GFA family protein [Marinobacter sp. SS21]
MNDSLNAQCPCASTQFSLQGKALMRGFCHCTICQAFNQSGYADITVFRAKDVTKPDPALVDFKSYRSPPVLQRGKCSHCHKPAIEYFHLFPMPELVIVPTANILDSALIPEPSLHIFYNRRVEDIQDNLPKYSGYLRSQLAFGQQLVMALWRRGR